mgnify:CR=1 FL=1
MRKKGVAFRRMMVSFAAVFLIPLCLVFAFYYFSYGVMEKQLETANDNLVATIQSTCDKELKYCQKVLTTLSVNKLITKSANAADYFAPQTQSELSKLILEVNETRTSLLQTGADCIDLFVYFPEVDRIFSSAGTGSMRLNTYLEQFFTKDQTFISKMKERFRVSMGAEIYSSDVKRGNGQTVFLTYCGRRNIENSAAVIGVVLDMDSIAKRVQSEKWSNGYNWLILNEDQVIIKGVTDLYRTGDTISLEELEEDADNMIFTAPSDFCDWTYVLIVPREELASSVGQIQIFFAAGLCISVLMAIILIYKATILNYKPLEKLIQSLQVKKDDAPDHVNEYQFLSSKIKELITDKTSAESNITRSKRTLEQWGLTNLLIKPYQSTLDRGGNKLEPYANTYADGQNMVLLMKIRAGGNDSLPDRQKMFVIENVFAERVGEILNCAIVEIESRQVMVLHDRDIHGKLWRVLEEISELQQFIWDNFEFRVAVSSGSISYGAEGIHKSYLEARETEEFILILEQDYISYEEIQNITCQGYQYSLQAEERISAAVHNDNAQLATVLIGKIIESSWDNEKFPPSMRRYLLSDIYCTLLKTADEKGCIHQIMPMPKDLNIAKSADEVQQIYAAIVDSICKESSAEEGSRDRALCDRVLEYIHENYSDPSMNISQTAFHFHLSPASLSTLYKNETGKSLLSTINEIRIEKAIELLKQGCSVAETAERVGIPESSSFIRLFKKMVGTTPGKIKGNL